jgi:hypothetical protein
MPLQMDTDTLKAMFNNDNDSNDYSQKIVALALEMSSKVISLE